ncbi:MAG: hypothetical protein AB8H80_14150 [Planctomycetota bacterium]
MANSICIHTTRLAALAGCAAIFLGAAALTSVGARSQQTRLQKARAASSEEQQQRIVFKAFPEANAYRKIHREINQDGREKIEKQLPFKVHFDELGRHSLVVAFRGRRPVGLIYTRTEEADWGLTAIAWQITLDRRVVGLQFTRGRNRHMEPLQKSRFADRLVGSDFEATLALLKAHDAADHAGRQIDQVSLERTVLRSAAKTLAVIRSIWRVDVEQLQDQATGFDLFPAAARLTRRAKRIRVDRIDAPGSAAAQLQIKALFAYDLANTLLGCVAWTGQPGDPAAKQIRWTVDRNMRVLAVESDRTRRDIALRRAAANVRGQLLSKPPPHNNEITLVARSLGAVLPNLAGRRSR